jgi:hypothetical protein
MRGLLRPGLCNEALRSQKLYKVVQNAEIISIDAPVIEAHFILEAKSREEQNFSQWEA